MFNIQNVLLKWFDEWQNQQEALQMEDGSRNGVVGEVRLGRGTLGSQANTI